MLDEIEFRRIEEAHRRCAEELKEACRAPNVDVVGLVNARFEPMRRLYADMTGCTESNHLAILHHRITLYGPPCDKCGKTLRAPMAKSCIECGHKREPGEWQQGPRA